MQLHSSILGANDFCYLLADGELDTLAVKDVFLFFGVVVLWHLCEREGEQVSIVIFNKISNLLHRKRHN